MIYESFLGGVSHGVNDICVCLECVCSLVGCRCNDTCTAYAEAVTPCLSCPQCVSTDDVENSPAYGCFPLWAEPVTPTDRGWRHKSWTSWCLFLRSVGTCQQVLCLLLGWKPLFFEHHAVMSLIWTELFPTRLRSLALIKYEYQNCKHITEKIWNHTSVRTFQHRAACCMKKANDTSSSISCHQVFHKS